MKNFKKVMAFLVVTVMVAGLLTACMSPAVNQSSKTQNAQSAENKQDVKIKIGLPVYTMEHPYYIEFVEAAKRKAAELNVELIVTDAAFDSVKQVAITEDMVQQGINAIIMTAIDPKGIIPTLDMAASKGVKLIIEGTPLEKDGKPYGLTYVGVDNYNAALAGGEWAGKYIKEKLGGKAKMAIISFPVDPASLNREKGFIDGVKKVCGEDAVVIASQNGEAVRDKSMAVMENILTANPDINVVFGINDDSALGALAAMEARGMGKNNELVVSFDGTKDGRDAVRKGGMLKCAVFQSPTEIAYKCIEACVKAIRGETLSQITGVGTKLITAENVNEFDK